jgi:hypothetical protein
MRHTSKSKWMAWTSLGIMVALLLGGSLMTRPAQAQIRLTYANFPPGDQIIKDVYALEEKYDKQYPK